ncbi:Hypothetical predicted protein [Olea europaea subsp. europaea]|uniref:Uncharacterized protein n=1 Tax=Olea europaea subsp. europaea TaxID=158383 RepID=A0A8S0QCZ5_OLEEU|nr:Hypothetical predicted protein [Olea europaea subsp. europaea]
MSAAILITCRSSEKINWTIVRYQTKISPFIEMDSKLPLIHDLLFSISLDTLLISSSPLHKITADIDTKRRTVDVEIKDTHFCTSTYGIHNVPIFLDPRFRVLILRLSHNVARQLIDIDLPTDSFFHLLDPIVRATRHGQRKLALGLLSTNHVKWPRARYISSPTLRHKAGDASVPSGILGSTKFSSPQ